MIKASSIKLGGPTGIGTNDKFRAGIQWKVLKDIVFDLVQKGIIKIIKDADGNKTVDLTELEKIEVGLSFFILTFLVFHSLY